MSILDLFKKKKGDAPPDVGQEETSSKTNQDYGTGIESDEEGGEANEEYAEDIINKFSKKKKGKGKLTGRNAERNYAPAGKSFELERLNARLEAFNSLIKNYTERISNMSEQIGEVRAMGLSNEKAMAKLSTDSIRAVDIVREIKPEKLRVDYQRAELKLVSLTDKIEANKQFMETIMNEIQDLRRKAGIFVGTDALLKLNEEVKKDLVEIQKTNSRVKLNADRSEQIFVELKRGFAENQKLVELVNSLDVNYSGLQKEIGKSRMDFANIVSNNTFSDFKKELDKKFIAIEGTLSPIEEMKQHQDKLNKLIENILLITRKNKEDIDDLAATLGEEHVTKESDYDKKIEAVLNIVDSLAGEIRELKEKKENKTAEKIKIFQVNESKASKKETLHLRHMNVSPKLSKPLMKKKKEIPEPLKKMHKRGKDFASLIEKKGNKIYDIDQLSL